MFGVARFTKMIQQLPKVRQCGSTMSLSISKNNKDGQRFEWSGKSLWTFFAQGRYWKPSSWWLLFEIVRFNHTATDVLSPSKSEKNSESIEEYLRRNGYSDCFRRDYFLPMLASIWSIDIATFSGFPAAVVIHFMSNHRMLSLWKPCADWRTIEGASIRYIQALEQDLGSAGNIAIFKSCSVVSATRTANGTQGKLLNLWRLRTGKGSVVYDGVIFATHPHQALEILNGTIPEAVPILKAIRCRENEVVMHHDSRVGPPAVHALSMILTPLTLAYAAKRYVVCMELLY